MLKWWNKMSAKMPKKQAIQPAGHSLLHWATLLVLSAGLIGLSQQLSATAAAYHDQLYQQVAALPVTRPSLIARLPGAERPVVVASASDILTPSGRWVLVNKTKLLPLEYKPTGLTKLTVSHSQADGADTVHGSLLAPLDAMFAAAARDGHQLMVGSAYRSAALQQQYFDTYVAQQGLAVAERYSAHPGASEHQTGLAVDISSRADSCFVGICSIDAGASAWLAAHAHQHGFVVRYAAGKEAITGYNYEPWHLRYLGIELATALHQSNLAYEEAVPYLLKTAP